MTQYQSFSAGSIFPAAWLGMAQEFTSTLVSNLRLSVSGTPNANSVIATASSGSGQCAIGVGGLYRYRDSLASVVISGTSGTYDIYAVASARTANEDGSTTNGLAGYPRWYLAFVSGGGSAPTGNTVDGQAIAATRKIAEVDFDGTNITALRQLVGHGDSTLPLTPTAPSGIATVVPLTVRGDSTQTANLLQIGTSTATNRVVLNAAGQLQLPVTGINGGLLLGGDALLYRSAASTLRTSGNLTVDGAVSLSSSGGTIGFFGATAAARATGYGSGTQVGTKAALTSSSSLNDVIAVVSSLVADLRTYGLIAS